MDPVTTPARKGWLQTIDTYWSEEARAAREKPALPPSTDAPKGGK